MLRGRMNMWAGVFVAVLVCAIFTSAYAQDTGQIAFISERDGGSANVFIMGADGSNPTNLTSSPDFEDVPTWSPDGQTLAFTRNLDEAGENWDIFTMAANGSGVTQLTTGEVFTGDIQWSLDGTQLFFQSSVNFDTQLYVVNADGSDRLSPLSPDSPSLDNAANSPDLSPDGTQLVFSTVGRTPSIILLDLASGPEQTLISTEAGALVTNPIWSPDGTHIVYMGKENPDADWELFVMNADGSAVTQLTDNDATDATSVWSPDGSQIAYTSLQDGNAEVYVMGADGSNPVNLSQNASADQAPVWSPDGSQIAFISDRDGNFEIYVMNPDGTNPVNLTNDAANDYSPAWRPTGEAAE